ncbi:hypothetical protein HED55_00300 [Ochrobactrum haematophilum]|uniref:Uncharacterized protein n=1 Tax=Brucella haematophila TaxID=419474 RepID=A0ABX1DNE5_9HYPH|nr:hypothetical protein [Brucella haematophila]
MIAFLENPKTQIAVSALASALMEKRCSGWGNRSRNYSRSRTGCVGDLERYSMPDPHFKQRRDAIRAEAITNALLHRADPENHPLTTEGARDFVGYSLVELARDTLENGGVSTRGMSRQEIAEAAMQVRSSGMHTADAFPTILTNVLNKSLRSGYEAAPQTFRPLSKVSYIPDFKEVARVQLSEAPTLEAVGEHGQFKHGDMGEASERFHVETFGKIVSLTRQTIINDDIGAFTRIPRAFGVQAAQLESDVVWAQIIGNPTMGDGLPLFHSSIKIFSQRTGSANPAFRKLSFGWGCRRERTKPRS